MQFIDTHTHLYLDEFLSDRNLLIDDAIKKGVTRFLTPNIDSSSIDAMLALAAEYPQNCFPMMGLHPTSVKDDYKEELAIVEKLISILKSSTNTEPKTPNFKPFIAIGEVGLDFYWDKTFIPQQKEVFRRQVELANYYKLPLSIHSRDSMDAVLDILRETKKEQPCGVMHCFTGNLVQAQHAVDLGFALGIGGVVTFKNAGLAETIQDIDLKHLVLETDAPYLAPVPFRGKRNLPSYIIKVAEKLAEVKQVSVEEVADATTKNANKIFNFNFNE